MIKDINKYTHQEAEPITSSGYALCLYLFLFLLYTLTTTQQILRIHHSVFINDQARTQENNTFPREKLLQAVGRPGRLKRGATSKRRPFKRKIEDDNDDDNDYLLQSKPAV